MFSRTERCIRSASARSAGTYTSPARMASAGWRKDTPVPSTRRSPPLGRSDPARMSNSSSWPWPSRATTPSTSPGYRSKETSLSFVPELRLRALTRGIASAGRPATPPAATPETPATRPDRSLAMSPSISSTIRCSEPAVTSTTPTVTPSRRTVARSQTAAISIIRCEMKMTERFVPRWRATTSRTRSVRFAGRAAVISSSRRMSGSIARARARSMIRSDASGTSRATSARSRSGKPSSASQWRVASIGDWVRRRFDRMSRSGMSAGSW